MSASLMTGSVHPSDTGDTASYLYISGLSED